MDLWGTYLCKYSYSDYIPGTTCSSRTWEADSWICPQFISQRERNQWSTCMAEQLALTEYLYNTAFSTQAVHQGITSCSLDDGVRQPVSLKHLQRVASPHLVTTYLESTKALFHLQKRYIPLLMETLYSKFILVPSTCIVLLCYRLLV